MAFSMMFGIFVNFYREHLFIFLALLLIFVYLPKRCKKKIASLPRNDTQWRKDTMSLRGTE